jgi:hypothetical protein
MTNPTWPIGPARTRDGREARIYATDGMGNVPIHGAILYSNGGWGSFAWGADGRRHTNTEDGYDLIPPKLTRDEAIAECLRAYYDGPKMVPSVTAMNDAITHWEKLKAEGRIDG